MNLSKFKESRIKNKFLKKLLKESSNRIVSQKEIKSVAILTTHTIADKINLQAEIETVLGVKNPKIYSFRKFDKSNPESFQHFSEKDINWSGEFVEPTFQNFLEQPFDLLIGYFDTNHLYLEKAVYQSKATFKAGFSKVNSKLYEIEISEAINNTQQFLSELKRYLQILKKIKN
ncbi:hypothetical protein [uncultured Polaribacter sp.]|uniref:DUF6913 domain-containing protein n=1 Tax=uncultured Polaribacter sp. TaxID=174711 RepID=UPI0026097C31|nr:hypothetical protein [uncultured Polaribacter sp.]